MTARGHETIEHTADMGIRGWGATAAEAFEEAASAMFELIAERSALRPSVSVPLRRSAPDITGLLLEFLNALIAEADVGELALAVVAIEELAERRGRYTVRATASGVPLEEARGALRIEVKAATSCGAFVRRESTGRWVAQCVVDL